MCQVTPSRKNVLKAPRPTRSSRTSDARSARADVTLQPTTIISLGPSEVIAQGIVASATELENINPNAAAPLNGFQIVVDAVSPI